MTTRNRLLRLPVLATAFSIVLLGLFDRLDVAQGQSTQPTPKNLFNNAGFENGRDGWDASKAGATVVKYSVDRGAAASGEYSALLAIDAVEQWGVQFGQFVEGGAKGKTFTFAALARSVGPDPVALDLQIERHAKPYDRAARSKSFRVTKDEWTELFVTFKVDKDMPEGWFAYVSCNQPKCQFRLDYLRLYEGEYVPWKQAVKSQAAEAGAFIFDTGTPSAQSLTGETLAKRAGWTQLPEDTLKHPFKGDVVLANSRIAAVLRTKGRGAEIHSLGQAGERSKLRSMLGPATTAPAQLDSVAIVENSPDMVSIDATFRAGDGQRCTLNYELKMGQVFVKVEPRTGLSAARIESPSRFAVLPDFFADDIVIDAGDLRVDRAELPSENFLLNLIDSGEAITMAVWTQHDEDIRVTLSGEGPARTVSGVDIPFGPKGKVWLAVMSSPNVWHVRDIAKADADKVIPLDWKAPFPALWRVDWRRDDRLADSWEMIAQQKGGQFTKFGWFGSPQTIPADRKRWTTVLGDFRYPCWVDQAGQGFLQPLKKTLKFEGPAVVYPINRVSGTPLDTFTVTDIVRATLGVGPCEYILDVEGQRSEYKGRATCANRDTLNPIFEKGQQKDKKAEIDKSLTEVVVFIRHIRDRIEGYVNLGHETLKFLDAQKLAHPELAKPIDELATAAKAIDQKFDARKDKIKTPDQAAAMVDAFAKGWPGFAPADAFKKCKEFAAAIVVIGGNQDELVGECRWAVKVLRQKASLAVAGEPRMAEIAREIRKRTQEVLRSPAGHEGARH